MISAECFSILYCCGSRTEVLTGYWIMLGIKDEFPHMLLISHFLLLFSFLILILIFAIFLSVKIPGYRREGGGWLGGVVRSPEASYFSLPQPGEEGCSAEINS